MEIAKTVSLRSPDPKLQVGSILVSQDFKRILGWGYNGPVTKQTNTRKSDKPGKSGFIHSEINCLVGAPQEKGFLFVTTMPCEDCARVIANSDKVERVYFNKQYRNDKGYWILFNSNIPLYEVK